MTRIVLDEAEEIEDLKKTLQQEVKNVKQKKKPRSLYSCRSCFGCFGFIVIILLILGFISFLKTGLIEVPYLSPIFYTEPKPDHAVELDKAYQYLDLSQFLASKIGISNFQTIVSGNEQLELKFELDEQELNYMLSKALDSESENAYLEQGQVAVLNDEIELFFEFKKPLRAFLSFKIIPIAEGGRLKLEIIEQKLGQLSLPKVFSEVLLDKQLMPQLNSLIKGVYIEKVLIIPNESLEIKIKGQ